MVLAPAGARDGRVCCRRTLVFRQDCSGERDERVPVQVSIQQISVPAKTRSFYGVAVGKGGRLRLAISRNAVFALQNSSR
jgi:hypothetical protein